MDGRKWPIGSLVPHLVESLLQLYPARFHREFSAEILEVVLSRLHDADLRGQRPSAVFREVAGLVPSIIQERWHELRLRKEMIMVIANEKPRWSFYFGWVGLNVTAVVTALYITWLTIAQITKIVGGTMQVGGESHITEDFLFMYVLLPSIGLATGIVQYILLRRYLPRMVWWIAATLASWLTLLLMRSFIGFLRPSNSTFSIMLGLLLIGATMALPQWWILRQRIRHAYWWVLAYGLGWCMVGLLSLATPDPLPVLIVVALIPTIATGLACWLLLDWFPKREAASRAGG